MPINLDLIYVLFLIVYLEGILSIDNAAVLGAMVSGLPVESPIPWPRSLQFLASPLQRLLGGQRVAALKVGLLGAYLGRGLMLFFANLVIHNPWLKILGGLYLIKLAFENLGEAEPGEEEQVESARIVHKSFWSIVVGVELADLAFSLDNVVAVVAISDNYWLVLFGVAMGILTMRFAAGIFTRLIAREPVLKAAAYVIVLNIGVELLVEEFYGFHINEIATFAISASTLILAIIYAHLRFLHVVRPVFIWLAEGMANTNELMDWAIKPFTWIARVVFTGIAAVVKRALPKPSSTNSEILRAKAADE